MLSTFLKRFLAFTLLAICFQAYSQEIQIQNISVNSEGNKVTVTFKVNGKFEGERYRIQVYSSHDSFRDPLEYITGDISPGQEVEYTNEVLSFVWDAQREIRDDFNRQVTLELRGEVIYTPLRSNQKISAKQSKTTLITWQGGNPGDNIKIDLMRGNTMMETLSSQVDNTGRWNWDVGNDVTKGSDYSIQLSNLSEGDTFQYPRFKVSGKGNPLLIIAPIGALAIGGVAYFLLRPVDDGGDPTGGESLPGAPEPE